MDFLKFDSFPQYCRLKCIRYTERSVFIDKSIASVIKKRSMESFLQILRRAAGPPERGRPHAAGHLPQQLHGLSGQDQCGAYFVVMTTGDCVCMHDE